MANNSEFALSHLYKMSELMRYENLKKNECKILKTELLKNITILSLYPHNGTCILYHLFVTFMVE